MQQHPSRIAAAALVLALSSGLAAAQQAPAPEPHGVLGLSASAEVEIPNDTLQVVLGTTKDGADAGAVQNALKQAIDAALTEAKKVAKPGQVEVRTGNFSLYPRYGNKGGINGWQGSAELIIEGRDLQAIGHLTGRLPTVTVQRVGYSLSREAREKVEADVVAQAIARYRAKAAEMSKQFGYAAGYSIREVSVNTNESGGGHMPVPLKMARAEGMMADAALPVEPGKGTVTATVSGTVQMK